jgi:membrane fusion protein, multidrug efflux system
MIALRPGMSVIPTIETRAPEPAHQANADSQAPNTVSANTSFNGACHVKSHPVSLDRRASDLFSQI